jgi:predicted alpha-1,2-mannosidase
VSAVRRARRRRPLTAVVAVAAVTALLAWLPAPAPAAASPRHPVPADPASDVNLFVGSAAGQPDFGTGGGAGNTYPGAAAPFGMLAWSPDTYPSSVNFAGGYTYGDREIEGFSLTHLSGAGCAVYQDVPILPVAVPVTTSPARPLSESLDERYRATFSHRGERAQPGVYEVALNPGTSRRIATELTAATRSGLGRFGFPRTRHAGLLVDVGGSAMAADAATVRIHPRRRLVTGSVTSGRFCYSDSRYRLFFAIRFDRAFSSYATWRRQQLFPGGTEASDNTVAPIGYQPVPGGPGQLEGDPSGTAQAGAYLGFDARDDRDVRVKVAVSYVDTAGALRNLRAEQRSWDMGAARARARAAWNTVLSRVAVSGVPARRRRVFYTALYRALQTPSVFSDVDGRYAGMDGVVRRSARTRYANFSGWDVYRTQMPLLAMLFPGRMSDIAQSLVSQADESGWLPKWSYANVHTGVMTGDPALPSLASARAFGARRFDVRGAVAHGERGATDPRQLVDRRYVVRPGVVEYNRLGYVPAEDDGHSPAASVLVPGAVWGSAATTLEYAVADFALSRMAAAVGEHAVAKRSARRARSWRRVFNEETGFVEPRSVSGAFEPAYDPAAGDGFVEGNAAQYTWFVPHAVAGLVRSMGGPRVATRRLDRFFTHLNAGPGAPYAFLGNEPSLGSPWLYSWLGRPAATQDVVRRTMAQLYKDTPGGLPGNDDLGTMSAWHVLSALGLYPAIPGTDVLVLTTPQFPHAVLHLPGGAVRIAAPDTRSAPFVRRLSVDGRMHTRPWIRFADLRDGATLRYTTTASRRTGWGTRPADAPPSY